MTPKPAVVWTVVILWVGTLELLTDLATTELFGIAFWLAFVMHSVVAEAWIHNTRSA